MSGVTRLYISASALALAGMAWRTEWFGSPEFAQIGGTLLIVISVLIGFVAVVTLGIAAVLILPQLLWRSMKAVVARLTPPAQSNPGSEP